MIYKLFNRFYALSEHDCKPAMLLGREAAIQFEPSLHNDFELKPRSIMYSSISHSMLESTKLEVEQLGISLNNTREGIVVNETIHQFCPVMVLFA